MNEPFSIAALPDWALYLVMAVTGVIALGFLWLANKRGWWD